MMMMNNHGGDENNIDNKDQNARQNIEEKFTTS
jgi:hypothetical protein